MWINLPGLAGLWTIYKPPMFWGRILKDSNVIGYVISKLSRKNAYSAGKTSGVLKGGTSGANKG